MRAFAQASWAGLPSLASSCPEDVGVSRATKSEPAVLATRPEWASFASLRSRALQRLELDKSEVFLRDLAEIITHSIHVIIFESRKVFLGTALSICHSFPRRRSKLHSANTIQLAEDALDGVY